MERERPEYLEAIPRTRWEFPWMALWAVLLASLVAAGVWQHMKTNEAWNARFETSQPKPVRIEGRREPIGAWASEQRKASISAVREARERAAAAELPATSNTFRCINGMTFRKIPGGWENLPDVPCP
jgi:hypothetical protein